jgi:hypothetical protein
MKTNFKKILFIVFLTITLSFTFECKNELFDSKENNEGFSGDTLKTLQSLKKVDDYPLFVMQYYGDYNFSARLAANGNPDAPANRISAKQDEKWGCTCFSAFGKGDTPLFGRNFDWRYQAALLLFTDPPNAFASVSMVDIHYCGYDLNPDLSTLKSREALLDTPFMPFDGLNEKGVAIGIMAVPYVELPNDPQKKTLSDLSFVRLVLDYAENTEHAISLIQQYNISMNEVPLHFLIADKTGKSALVEFVNNKMQVMYNQEAFQVSTNFIVSNTLSNVLGKCWRYDKSYQTLLEKSGQISSAEAKDILQGVSQSNTMWSTVYNLKSGDIQVVPGRKYSTNHQFKLKMSN